MKIETLPCILVAIVAAMASLIAPETASAGQHSGYVAAVGTPPAKGASDVVDRYNFYKGQCTSYCSYRLNQLGIPFSNRYKNVHFGNGKTWVAAARSLGIVCNTTPERNAVYCDTSGTYGHVAFVDSVNSDGSANLSEYNWSPPFGREYSTRSSVRANGSSTFFIHFINLPPVITKVTASCNTLGDITVAFVVTDSTSSSLVETAVWIRNGSMAVNGTYTTGATSLGFHQIVIPASKTRPVLTNGRVFSAAVRAKDNQWVASQDVFSNSFVFNSPTQASGPEIAIRYDSREIPTNVGATSSGNFGSVRLGSSLTRTFTVWNHGKTSLAIGSLSLSNTIDFSVASAPAATVAPGQSTSITIRFRPKNSGTRSCELRLPNNDANENPYRITIMGAAQ